MTFFPPHPSQVIRAPTGWTEAWGVYADACCHVDVWAWHLMEGRLKEVLVKMRTTAGVWTYRLFIWLSGTLSVTHSGVVGVVGGVCVSLREKSKRERNGDELKEESLSSSSEPICSPSLAANTVCSLSLSDMCTDKPCRRDMWSSHTDTHTQVSLKRSTFSMSVPIHQPWSILLHFEHSSYSWYSIEVSVMSFLSPQSCIHCHSPLYTSLMDCMDFFI